MPEGYLEDEGDQAHQQVPAHLSVNGKEGGKLGHHQTSLPTVTGGDRLILWETVLGVLPAPSRLPWEQCCSHVTVQALKTIEAVLRLPNRKRASF